MVNSSPVLMTARAERVYTMMPLFAIFDYSPTNAATPTIKRLTNSKFRSLRPFLDDLMVGEGGLLAAAGSVFFLDSPIVNWFRVA